MNLTNVNQFVYEQVLNHYYLEAVKFYDNDKFDCELSERKVSKFIRLIYVWDKGTTNLHAVCVLSITYDPLPSEGLNIDSKYLSSIRRDNQSEITKTDIAIFQIERETNHEINRRLYPISEPLKIYPAWSTIE
jgi:hypothetical protein